jgi:tRNA-Thr(GGU) m(6)t(6)A37 methyltransferase TsaA
MDILLKPVAIVRSPRTTVTDDHWGSVIAEIELAEGVPEGSFVGIESFSHLEIIYYFHQVGDGKTQLGDGKTVWSRRPRGNPAWPEMGIFAQRNKDRPNSIGLTTVELLEHAGRVIKVRWLDAIDGTPVLDIKPVFREFMPKGETRQPGWAGELTRDYWK